MNGVSAAAGVGAPQPEDSPPPQRPGVAQPSFPPPHALAGVAPPAPPQARAGVAPPPQARAGVVPPVAYGFGVLELAFQAGVLPPSAYGFGVRDDAFQAGVCALLYGFGVRDAFQAGVREFSLEEFEVFGRLFGASRGPVPSGGLRSSLDLSMGMSLLLISSSTRAMLPLVSLILPL